MFFWYRGARAGPVKRRVRPLLRWPSESDILRCVSPTVLRVRGYRFYFFSREEPRPHVHVQHAGGEAKFWLEPQGELGADYGLGLTRIKAARKIIEEHADDIRAAWAKHFGGFGGPCVTPQPSVARFATRAPSSL